MGTLSSLSKALSRSGGVSATPVEANDVLVYSIVFGLGNVVVVVVVPREEDAKQGWRHHGDSHDWEEPILEREDLRRPRGLQRNRRPCEAKGAKRGQ